MEKLQYIQPVLEVLKEDGSNLSDLAPGDAGLKVEETMKKDLQRYDAVSDQIQRRSQKVSKSKQRSSEVCVMYCLSHVVEKLHFMYYVHLMCRDE